MGFNEYKWGMTTEYYLDSIANLSNATWETIIDEAKKLAKATRHGTKSEFSSGPSTETWPINCRALLVDVPIQKCEPIVIDKDCKSLLRFCSSKYGLINWYRIPRKSATILHVVFCVDFH